MYVYLTLNLFVLKYCSITYTCFQERYYMKTIIIIIGRTPGMCMYSHRRMHIFLTRYTCTCRNKNHERKTYTIKCMHFNSLTYLPGSSFYKHTRFNVQGSTKYQKSSNVRCILLAIFLEYLHVCFMFCLCYYTFSLCLRRKGTIIFLIC